MADRHHKTMNIWTLIIALLIANHNYIKPANGQCTGMSPTTESFTGISSTVVGEITSNNYPSDYSNNIECVSTITTSIGSYNVLFYVMDKNIEIRWDFLYVISGSESGTMLYNSDDEDAGYVGYSSGTQLTVKFTADSSISFGGFKLYYIAVDISNQANCGAVSASTQYQQLSYVYRVQSSSCTWDIAATSAVIVVEVLLVHGYVSVYDSVAGTTQNIYTTGSVYVSSSNSVQIRGYVGNDFVVQYKMTDSATDNIITTTAPSDTSICNSATLTATSTTQYITSPNYPGQYPSNVNCLVNVVADVSTQSIYVEILDYAMLSYDNLVIYDGNSEYYNQYSPITTGSRFTSSGSSLVLLFSTDYYGQNRGFKLAYNSTARTVPVCGQNLLLEESVTASSTSHTIESPNYPGLYHDNDDLFWLITKPSETDNIVLEFRVVNVEEGLDCMYDNVSIYDGACTSDPLLARICGYSPVTFEDSTGIYILIRFRTDDTITKHGWALTHYIGNYGEEGTDDDDDAGNVMGYVYAIIGIVVILVIGTVVCSAIYFKAKTRVSAVEAKPAFQRRTPKDLLSELTSRYGSSETDKQQKAKRKGNLYHPQPNPQGQNVTVIDIRGQMPHPPPSYNDAAYPPAFIGVGTHAPDGNIAPMLTAQSNIIPTAPMRDVSTSSVIPPSFAYITPAQARSAGTYG